MYTVDKGERVFMIKKTLLFIGLLLSMLTVCAEDNVLQTIEIVPVKDTYNIVLTADKSVDVKKSVKDSNRITLDMKGIRASKALNTVYNNASNVDTVMVENTPSGISIFFQAENAQDASVVFDSIVPAVSASSKAASQKVTLNSPVDSYAPIYREDMAKAKTSNLFNKLTSKTSDLGVDIEDSVNEASDTMNRIFSYGIVGLLAFGVIKLFRRKDSNIKIGLSQSLNDREIDMYKNINSSGNAYSSTEKPFTTVNYGINAYKKENQNPYEQEPVKYHNPRMQQYISPLLRNQMAQAVIQQQLAQPKLNTATMTAPKPQPVKKHTTPVNTAPVNQGNPNIDNLKFLESMTAIYEKSGRHDLAQGLKASLSKNNLKV